MRLINTADNVDLTEAISPSVLLSRVFSTPSFGMLSVLYLPPP